MAVATFGYSRRTNGQGRGAWRFLPPDVVTGGAEPLWTAHSQLLNGPTRPKNGVQFHSVSPIVYVPITICGAAGDSEQETESLRLGFIAAGRNERRLCTLNTELNNAAALKLRPYIAHHSK